MREGKESEKERKKEREKERKREREKGERRRKKKEGRRRAKSKFSWSIFLIVRGLMEPWESIYIGIAKGFYL